MKEQVTKFVLKTFVLLGRPQKFSSGLKSVNMVDSVAIWVYLNVFYQVYQRATLGTRRFFLACVRELRFVGRRPTRVRPKAEDTGGEAARKNLWRRAP